MKKRKVVNKKLRLQKETIRSLVRSELQEIAGAVTSCGAGSACDCSGGGVDWKTDPTGTQWCSIPLY